MSSTRDSTASPPRPATEPPGSGAEAARKLIHVVVSLCAAAVVWLVPHPGGATVAAAAAAIALGVEVLRRAVPGFGRAFHRSLGRMLRRQEAWTLTGATHLALGFTLAAALFPGWPAVTGILVAGLADPVAALVGRALGRHRYRGGKSLEGSTAFLAVAWLVVWSVSGAGLATAGAIALALTLAEAARLPVNDNLYLPPLAAALVAVALGGPAAGGFS